MCRLVIIDSGLRLRRFRDEYIKCTDGLNTLNLFVILVS
jgi:hypothetical protein